MGQYDAVQADPKIKGAFDKAAKGAKTDKTKGKPLSDKNVKKVKEPENKGQPAPVKDAPYAHPKKIQALINAVGTLGEAIGKKSEKEEDLQSQTRSKDPLRKLFQKPSKTKSLKGIQIILLSTNRCLL